MAPRPTGALARHATWLRCSGWCPSLRAQKVAASRRRLRPSRPQRPSARQLLAQASRELVPTPVAGAELGMSEAELARARPAAHRHEAGDQPLWLAYTEAADRTHAYYFFSRTGRTLSRMQVLTTLEGHGAIGGRLRALQQRFGAAEMAFDCPPVPGQKLPIRRFVWMRGPVAGVDSYLLTDKTVSVTWSVEPRKELLASVGAARCDLVKSDRLSWFPSAKVPGRSLRRRASAVDRPRALEFAPAVTGTAHRRDHRTQTHVVHHLPVREALDE